MDDVPFHESASLVRQPVLMCSSCWKIQPPEDELAFEVDQWIDPTMFMANAVASARHYVLVDGYCEECLTDLVARVHSVSQASAHVRLNA